MDEADRERRGQNIVDGPLFPSVEHLVDLKDGGRDHPDNIVLAHTGCNRERDTGHLRSRILARSIRQVAATDWFGERGRGG